MAPRDGSSCDPVELIEWKVRSGVRSLALWLQTIFHYGNPQNGIRSGIHERIDDVQVSESNTFPADDEVEPNVPVSASSCTVWNGALAPSRITPLEHMTASD